MIPSSTPNICTCTCTYSNQLQCIHVCTKYTMYFYLLKWQWKVHVYILLLLYWFIKKYGNTVAKKPKNTVYSISVFDSRYNFIRISWGHLSTCIVIHIMDLTRAQFWFMNEILRCHTCVYTCMSSVHMVTYMYQNWLRALWLISWRYE